jgi:transcriptional regulator with XRE-family HTH domain
MNFCLEISNTTSTGRAETFGDWVLEKRTAQNWTQNELLTRAGNIITKSYLSQLENNRSNRKSGAPIRPSMDKVDAIAGALGASVNEARRLAGYPPSESEMLRDEVAERFTFALAKYRQLTPESQDFVDEQIEKTLDFAIGLQKLWVVRDGSPGGKHEQVVHFVTEEELEKMPVITREDLREKYRAGKPARAGKKK